MSNRKKVVNLFLKFYIWDQAVIKESWMNSYHVWCTGLYPGCLITTLTENTLRVSHQTLSNQTSASYHVTYVEHETICLWLYGHSLLEVTDSRLYSNIVGGSFSSNQATGKVFSTKHAIYSKFIYNYSPWGSCKLQTICVSLIWGCRPR